jgi:iron only hydrogenase large subunit-like protein|tara:strand:+ start:214 stop:423 length:210 start_codon:yes stop_codon:yes gene_type:complete
MKMPGGCVSGGRRRRSTNRKRKKMSSDQKKEEVVPGEWLKKEIARKTAELEAKGDPLAVYHGIVRSIFG